MGMGIIIIFVSFFFNFYFCIILFCKKQNILIIKMA